MATARKTSRPAVRAKTFSAKKPAAKPCRKPAAKPRARKPKRAATRVYEDALVEFMRQLNLQEATTISLRQAAQDFLASVGAET